MFRSIASTDCCVVCLSLNTVYSYVSRIWDVLKTQDLGPRTNLMEVRTVKFWRSTSPSGGTYFGRQQQLTKGGNRNRNVPVMICSVK